MHGKSFPSVWLVLLAVWVSPLQHIIATETEENELLAKVLGVLALLVKYGYYDDEEDVDKVLRSIISLLNGFNDLPYPPTTKPLARMSSMHSH